MRLYRTATGAWAGTQADARATCLDDAIPATAWEEIDVPTDKAGLLHWLDRNCGRAVIEAFKAECALDRIREREATRADHADFMARTAPPPVQPPPNRPAIQPSLTDVETFIQKADHRQLSSVTENAILRMRELAADAGR